MRVLKVYHHGITMGTPPTKNNHQRAKRSTVQGWSPSATRNNLKFLRSIHPDNYSNENEIGLTVTLTLRDCPETSKDWHSVRTSFFKRLNRMGLIRGHWVTEWQRRGVPHLHGVFYFPIGNPLLVKMIKDHWLDLTSEKYGSSSRCQYIKPVDNAVGWFQYMAKHAGRGVAHYQRSSSNIPEGWQSKTGRMWGHIGDWNITESVSVNVCSDFYFKLRRLIRSWRKADARNERQRLFKEFMRGKPVGVQLCTAQRRIGSSRRMLKCGDIKKSRVRGISEWMPSDTSLNLSEYLIALGADFEIKVD